MKTLMLGEISQSQKDTCWRIPRGIYEVPRGGQIHRHKKKNGDCQGLEEEEWELQLNRKNRNLLHHTLLRVSDVCTLRVLGG